MIWRLRPIKLPKIIFSIYFKFLLSLVRKTRIKYFNGLDLSIQMMKMEILIHELLHMFEKRVLMLSGFYLKKFIVTVLVKTRGTHFNPLLLLDPLLIKVLNIVVDQVLLVLQLQDMMVQEERGLMMVAILEMMVGILQIHNKVNIH